MIKKGGVLSKITKHIKRLTFIFSIIIISAMLISAPASAHVIKTDGYMTVEIHIEPTDDPVSQTPTTITMSFDDTTNLFTLPRCDCQLSILENNQIVATQTLDDRDLLISETNYTFPGPGDYILRLSGRPKQDNTFTAFTVSYNVIVKPKPSAQSNATTSSSIFPWIELGILAVSIPLVAYVLRWLLRHRGITQS